MEGQLNLYGIAQLPSCPLPMEFASALKAVFVFVGQPKQGWKLSFMSLTENLAHRIVSFCQTCPRCGQNSSWVQSGNEWGIKGVEVGQRCSRSSGHRGAGGTRDYR